MIIFLISIIFHFSFVGYIERIFGCMQRGEHNIFIFMLCEGLSRFIICIDDKIEEFIKNISINQVSH